MVCFYFRISARILLTFRFLPSPSSLPHFLSSPLSSIMYNQQQPQGGYDPNQFYQPEHLQYFDASGYGGGQANIMQVGEGRERE